MDFHHLQNIDNVLNTYVTQNKVAGVNLLIWKDGKEVLYRQAGFSDIENQKKFSRDTICRLYSMTKPVTCVAAMILVEQGKLDLAEDVGKYIPEFYNLRVSNEKGRNGKSVKALRYLTVQDLLNMTSGYTYGAYFDDSPVGEHLTSDLLEELNKDCEGPNKITTMQVAKRLAEIPVDFEPGTDYQYGLSADILGAVIETVSGMKFSDFLKKNIFNPLGMKDTDFYIPEEKQNRMSQTYQENGEKKMIHFTQARLGVQGSMKNKPVFESGGAGLCSTVDDYMKFTSMLTNKGVFDGKRILQEKTVEYLSSARLTKELQNHFDQKMAHLSGYTYCNLLRIAYEPGKCKMITQQNEFGWDGWLGPYMSVDLQNNLSIVMMMQKVDAGTWDLTRKIKNIIYTAL